MATTVTRTPPPTHSISEPRAPRYGAKFDPEGPQSIRKKARFSTQRLARTPSPGPSNLAPEDPFSTPRRSSRRQTANHSFSPPASPTASPQQSLRRKTKTKTDESSEPSSSLAPAMLPTPVKTPRKKDIKQVPNPASRVLFPSRPISIDDAMPNKRKRNRGGAIGHSRQSLSDEEPVVIYTDSRDKLPELDESADNPFYVKPGDKSTKRSKKQQALPSEMSKKVQEALERDEGMVYVFRGKKIYRKFDEDDEDIPDDTGMPLVEDGPDTPRHFPPFIGEAALLVPTSKEADVDEEAVTDIEEAKDPATPVKPVFQMPVSPPTTGRATRSTAKGDIPENTNEDDSHEEKSPFTVKKASKKTSPFNGWQRVKGVAGTSVGKGKKRAGSASLEESEPGKGFALLVTRLLRTSSY